MELTQQKHHSEKSIFVTSDLHLNHENIIKYCQRPFSSAREMNRVLINNWNHIISPNDTVYFVGDMAMGNSDRFISVLNGNIFFIWGNHDVTADPDGNYESLTLSYREIDFLFVHNPKDAPKDFDGWIIHGHHHNNFPRKFPFFNPEMRRINASVEMTNYAPVELNFICKLIEKGNGKKIIGVQK